VAAARLLFMNRLTPGTLLCPK